MIEPREARCVPNAAGSELFSRPGKVFCPSEALSPVAASFESGSRPAPETRARIQDRAFLPHSWVGWADLVRNRTLFLLRGLVGGAFVQLLLQLLVLFDEVVVLFHYLVVLTNRRVSISRQL